MHAALTVRRRPFRRCSSPNMIDKELFLMGLFRSTSTSDEGSYLSPVTEKQDAFQSDSSLRSPVNRDSVLAQGQTFEGTLSGEGSVRVDGTFKGEINLQGSVCVSAPGSLYGTIEATNVLISGTVEGNIIAHGKLRLDATCSLKGDVQAETLTIEDGAHFNGRSSMIISDVDRAALDAPLSSLRYTPDPDEESAGL